MIRKDVIYLAIILILLGIVAVMTCQSPDVVDSEGEKFKDSIKVLKSEKAFKAAQFDSVSTMANTLTKEKDSIVAASLSEISRLRAKATTAVQNIPVRVMGEYPEVPIALAYLDSVNQKQAVLIDTLKSQVEFERNVREQLTSLHYDQSKIEAQMSELKDMRIVKLEKDLKKERRRGRGWKALAVVGTVLGFIGGSQL